MSLLPAGTFASLNNSYYGSGGGGGGGGLVSSVSTLISPASISTVGGLSILNYPGSVNSVITQNNNGIFTMTGQPNAGPAVLPFIAYNTGTNLTTIGDGTSNALGGVVTTRQELLITDPRGPGNSLALTPTSATNSIIGQGCSSNGVINFGTSLAQLSTLVVYDQGASAGIVQVGGNGGAPVELLGGTSGIGVSNAPIVRPGVAVNGTMRIGSSFAAPNQIVVSDLSGVYFGSQYPPIWQSGSAVTGFVGQTVGGTPISISMAGLTDGLYLGMIGPFAPTGPTDAPTLGCTFSFNFYVKGGLCIMGGVSSNTAGNVYIQPASGLGSLVFTNGSGANIYVYCNLTKVTGPLPNF